MSIQHRHERKADVHDAVVNAIANFSEDLTAAQLFLDDGDGQRAKAEAEAAGNRLRAKVKHGIATLNVFCHHGRIQADLVFTDGFGTIEVNLKARRFS